jgi:hypothetical protein
MFHRPLLSSSVRPTFFGSYDAGGTTQQLSGVPLFYWSGGRAHLSTAQTRNVQRQSCVRQVPRASASKSQHGTPRLRNPASDTCDNAARIWKADSAHVVRPPATQQVPRRSRSPLATTRQHHRLAWGTVQRGRNNCTISSKTKIKNPHRHHHHLYGGSPAGGLHNKLAGSRCSCRACSSQTFTTGVSMTRHRTSYARRWCLSVRNQGSLEVSLGVSDNVNHKSTPYQRLPVNFIPVRCCASIIARLPLTARPRPTAVTVTTASTTSD